MTAPNEMKTDPKPLEWDGRFSTSKTGLKYLLLQANESGVPRYDILYGAPGYWRYLDASGPSRKYKAAIEFAQEYENALPDSKEDAR